MASQVQFRRGTTPEHASFTGAVGEITVDTDKDTVVVHDNSTAGGHPLMRENGSNSALALGSAATPSLKFTGDTNTGIYSPGADQVAISTNGSERFKIDSSGNITVDTNTFYVDAANNRVGVGTTSLNKNLQVATTGGGQLGVEAFGTGAKIIGLNSTNTAVEDLGFQATNTVFISGTERARFDSSGRLLVGTSSARSTIDVNTTNTTPQFQIEGGTSESAHSLVTRYAANEFGGYFSFAKTRSASIGGHAIVSDDDSLGRLRWLGDDGTDFEVAAQIEAFVDGTPGTDDMPGRLVFSTTPNGSASPTERMRISNDGQVYIATTTDRDAYLNIGNAAVADTTTKLRVTGYRNGSFYGIGAIFQAGSDSSAVAIQFLNTGGSGVGSIVTGASSTAYNTSSDYRLKENVTPVDDGITRLQQLKPSRFNFIADPNTTVDGFLAHEVQTVVPEAITGEKDAVDEDGNPEYQGIDQSKLVPLLTAALQEAIGRIETLEAEVAALKAP